jgi:hypothetical protein
MIDYNWIFHVLWNVHFRFLAVVVIVVVVVVVDGILVVVIVVVIVVVGVRKFLWQSRRLWCCGLCGRTYYTSVPLLLLSLSSKLPLPEFPPSW